MIIIATDLERKCLESRCDGECDSCLLGSEIEVDECPIGNKRIVVAEQDLELKGLYVDVLKTSDDWLNNDENSEDM